MSLFGHEDFFGKSHPNGFGGDDHCVKQRGSVISDALSEEAALRRAGEGLEKFSTDIYHEISYPTQALNHCIAGIVKVGVVVYADGEVGKIVILKGLGYGLDAEVLRAFNVCRKKTRKKEQPQSKPAFDFYEIEINFMINGISPQDGGVLIVDSQTFRNCSDN
ncbi:hypothetical protein BKI52_23380 [marine bacterium AO1-C]|nr:hypothetical protein BKI52_23380 [marine bacterium AO1-C]